MVFSSVRRSLSSKLSLGILLMAVPVLVAALGLYFYQSQISIRDGALRRVSNELNNTMMNISRSLTIVETATNTSGWLIAEKLHPDSILALSRRIVQLNRHVDGCSISTEPNLFPQYGRYFSAYTVRQGDSIITVVEEQYEYFSKVWYKKPRELGKACWVDYFDESDSLTVTLQGMLTSYSKPIYNKNGEMIAVISSDISLLHLSQALKAEKPYPNSYFVMIGEDGNYIVHPDSAKLFTQTIFTDVDAQQHPDIIALGHEMLAGKKGSLEVSINGQPHQVCYQPVPNTKWSLALVCPDSDIFQDYTRLKYIITLLIFGGFIIILLLTRRAVAHTISPLNLLVKQSQRIAAGQYDVRIPKIKYYDAIGRLQTSFATMQQSLQRHVSEIKEANEETTRRNEELFEATKLAEEATVQKTAFIQNMTHQIRTPLNIIMGFAQVLRDSLRQLPEEEVGSIGDMMKHNAGTLNRMVQMLFDSSDTGLAEEMKCQKNDEVSCNEVARESIMYTKMHFPELGIRFESDLPDDLCILTSRLYLMRSLREILYNAAKYSDGKNVSLHIKDGGTKVQFVFEDTGPGMDKDYHELMFKPFTKVNDLSEGLGLGLPLAKRHVVNLGGDLTLDTGYTKGCRFILEIPK